jgi:Rnl2 family RNA ligase
MKTGTMFRKYQSIKRATDVVTLDYYIQQGWDRLQWYATSKVHGTNFSFISDGNEVKYAQRTQVTDSIFGSHLDVHKVEDKIKQLAKHLGKTIQVYGEYYGGGSSIAGKSSIPYFKDESRKEFIFFDIRLADEDVFVEYPLNFELFDKFEIPRVPLIYEGTLHECLKQPKSFKSLVAETDCIEEGYVVKPFKPLFVQDSDRVIMKMIAPEFDDVKKGTVDLKVAKQKQDNFDLYNFTKQVIDEKVNAVRCDKVAAKFGLEAQYKKNFGLLLNALVEDIIDETEEKVNEEQIKKACINIVKGYFN